MTVNFKLGEKASREAIAALMPVCPWWAKERLESLLDSKLGIQIVVEPVRRKHTDSQRNFYHLCVDRLAKHLGMSHDALHEEVLCEWGGSKEVDLLGRTVRVPMHRSSKLPVEAYAELIETLARFFAFCGYPMPDPSEVAA